MTEKDFMAQVLAVARLYKWTCYHTFYSQRSVQGYPDLHLIKPPHSIFAELKNERGKIHPEQQAWIDMLKACGYEAYIWRPGDWDMIVQRLTAQS